MSVFALMLLIGSAVTVYLGDFVYSQNRRAKLNQVFAIFCVTTALGGFGEFLYLQVSSLNVAYPAIKMTGFIWIISAALALHVSLIFTEKTAVLKYRGFVGAFYTLIMTFFLAAVLSPLIIDTQPSGYSYVAESIVEQGLIVVWAAIFAVLPFALVINYALKAHGRKRAEALFVSAGFAVHAVTGVLAAVLSQVRLSIPEGPSFGLMTMALIVGYTLWKYELFVVSAVTTADSIIATMTDLLTVFDEKGKIVQVNKMTLDCLGYKEDELIGQSADKLWVDLSTGTSLMTKLMGGRTVQNRDIEYQTKSGKVVPVLFSASLVFDKRGDIAAIVGVANDITEWQQAEKAIKHMAYHDLLTGLPNRRLMEERAVQAFAYAERNHNMLAFFFIDLDKMKFVNDGLGHHVGDHLLKAVTVRLRSCLRSSDIVARVGGDEFNIVLSDFSDERQVDVVAKKICDELAHPFVLNGHELSTGASLGISVYPRDGADLKTLSAKADIAMYSVKDDGGNGFLFWSEKLGESYAKSTNFRLTS